MPLSDQGRVEAILAAAGDGFLVFDDKGRLAYANQAASTLLARDLSELIDTPLTLSDLLDIEREPERGEAIEITTTDPEPRVLRIRANPVLEPDGAVSGHVVSLHDVTAEREASVMKNEFVSMVSHELRTPLTSIKGYVDLIVGGDAGEINDIQREFLEIVQENSDRLVSLINEILDISRIESGRVHLRMEPLDLGEVIQGAIDTFRTVAENSGIALEWRVEEPLPRAAGDPDRVGQVLLNLVSNAIKYSPGGGKVKVEAYRRDEFVVTSVSDTGIGIPYEDQERLFTKFFRVDSSDTRDIGGTGLGLSICKSVVELLGGSIEAKSIPGEGSTFSFSLPVASCELVRTPEIEGPLSGGSGLVMVIEHDVQTCKLICAILNKRGYETACAHTAEDAFRTAVLSRPRAITLDPLLEDMDGFDLLRRLKEDERTSDIPVVVLSVLCDEGRSLRLGAASYLEKPIDQNRLADIVNGIVGSRDSALVLIADDDRDIVDALKHTLRARGFAAAVAYDGREVMAAVAKQRPDLILLDLKMPEMDGYQVIQAIKGDPETRDIPIVVMTAHRLDTARTDLLALVDEQVTKPLSPETLVDWVERVLAEEGDSK